jgi:hypothetical protein
MWPHGMRYGDALLDIRKRHTDMTSAAPFLACQSAFLCGNKRTPPVLCHVFHEYVSNAGCVCCPPITPVAAVPQAQFDLAQDSVAAAAAAASVAASDAQDLDQAGARATMSLGAAPLRQHPHTPVAVGSAPQVPEEPAEPGTHAAAGQRAGRAPTRPLDHLLAQLLGATQQQELPSPTSPLELDEASWKHGEPSERVARMGSLELRLDPHGFVVQDPEQRASIQVRLRACKWVW